MPKQKRPRDPRNKDRTMTINFFEQPVMERFVQAIGYGLDGKDGNEIGCFGSRGDGKTIGALCGMIEHARQHHRAGYMLPVHWMGVTDTFTSHKLKTVRSLENPLFCGGWKLSDGDHVATFYIADGSNLVPMVHLDLFGIEDQGAMDRVRMETVGVWFEEPAPAAVMVQSSGISEDAWMLARTSQRLPSHFHPAVATLNLPDEDHWTWQRWKPTSTPCFAKPEQFKEILLAAGIQEKDWPVEFSKYPMGVPTDECFEVDQEKQWYRIPVGERASHDDRLMWARSLKERPDMLRRLILGQPGVVLLGDQVAKGFSFVDHVSRETIPLLPGEPLYMGFDFGHTPTCVIAQQIKFRLVVKAGLYLLGQGMRQLMEERVMPWLGRYAPWTLRNPDQLCLIGYDPSGDTGEAADIENSAKTMIEDVLGGGDFEPGPVRWDTRKDALVRVFNRAHSMVIEQNEFTKDLIRALEGRWYMAKSPIGELRSDRPKKPNHPWEDLGDSFIYLLCRFGVVSIDEDEKKNKIEVDASFNPFQIQR